MPDNPAQTRELPYKSPSAPPNAQADITPFLQAFAIELIANRGDKRASYLKLKPKAKNSSASTVCNSIKKIMDNPNFQQYYSELTARVASKVVEAASVSLDSLTIEYEEAREVGKEQGQASGMVAATKGKADLHGFGVQQHQHQHLHKFADLSDTELQQRIDRLAGDSPALVIDAKVVDNKAGAALDSAPDPNSVLDIELRDSQPTDPSADHAAKAEVKQQASNAYFKQRKAGTYQPVDSSENEGQAESDSEAGGLDRKAES